jgi:hypothetical protein
MTSAAISRFGFCSSLYCPHRNGRAIRFSTRKSEVSLLGLTRSGFRQRSKDWVDTVLECACSTAATRAGGSFWADVGDGSDSSSEQLMALASYRGDGNWQYFGGYRYLNLEYDRGSGSSQFGVDLDYTGPMFGASYRM